MHIFTSSFNEYTITTDKSLLQPTSIHSWLSKESYWCKGMPYDVFKVAFDYSYSIGVIYQGDQVAYARLVTDYATFAYLADVYVVTQHRGKGISKKMIALLLEQDWVSRLRRLVLVTLDAHELYKQYGFTTLKNAERYMEIGRPGIYQQTSTDNNDNKSIGQP